MLEPLTPEEVIRHHKAIDKIRQRLFRRFKPADYFIIDGSESIIMASADGKWCPERGSYRVFSFGGIEYQFDAACKEGPASFSIRHEKGAQFWFSLSSDRKETVKNLPLTFDWLDVSIHRMVNDYRGSQVNPKYTISTKR
ncbi:MAG TPA: hypothetical protein VK629_07495 [Steroidobacteraceae bacterium]|nr:hypothetical protein [Steroidobacteraceae bacterium]